MRDLGDAGKHAAASDYAAVCATAAEDAVQSTTPWQVGRIPRQTAEESVTFMGDGERRYDGRRQWGHSRRLAQTGGGLEAKIPRESSERRGAGHLGHGLTNRQPRRSPPRGRSTPVVLSLCNSARRSHSPAIARLHCHRPGYSKAPCLAPSPRDL
jgi:hypothetical protein